VVTANSLFPVYLRSPLIVGILTPSDVFLPPSPPFSSRFIPHHEHSLPALLLLNEVSQTCQKAATVFDFVSRHTAYKWSIPNISPGRASRLPPFFVLGGLTYFSLPLFFRSEMTKWLCDVFHAFFQWAFLFARSQEGPFPMSLTLRNVRTPPPFFLFALLVF